MHILTMAMVKCSFDRTEKRPFYCIFVAKIYKYVLNNSFQRSAAFHYSTAKFSHPAYSRTLFENAPFYHMGLPLVPPELDACSLLRVWLMDIEFIKGEIEQSLLGQIYIWVFLFFIVICIFLANSRQTY